MRPGILCNHRRASFSLRLGREGIAATFWGNRPFHERAAPTLLRALGLVEVAQFARFGRIGSLIHIAKALPLGNFRARQRARVGTIRAALACKTKRSKESKIQ